MDTTCVIVNPRAGSASQWPRIHERLGRLQRVQVHETTEPGDATKRAERAVREGCSIVVAAGGDGTVNEVVNGLMRRPNERVALGIVPLGTGNDLPRTLGLPDDPLEAIDVIGRGRTMKIDLIKATWADQQRFVHNVAAGGFTGQVDEVMTDDLKARWGPLAYLRGAIGVLPDLTKYKTTIRYDGKPRQSVSAMNVIVANGRTAGGGIIVASQADPSDGLLDVVVVRSATKLELAGVAARLLAGDYTNSDAVTHRRARRVEVESNPGMWFKLDGELTTNEPIVFSVQPKALDVIVPAAP